MNNSSDEQASGDIHRQSSCMVANKCWLKDTVLLFTMSFRRRKKSNALAIIKGMNDQHFNC
jgi:hypothetical protein